MSPPASIIWPFYITVNRSYDAAEPLYKRALEIREMNVGKDDPAVLQTLQFSPRCSGRKAKKRKRGSSKRRPQEAESHTCYRTGRGPHRCGPRSPSGSHRLNLADPLL